MIYHLLMDKKMVMLDGLIVKQAVRDIASKKPDLSRKKIANDIAKVIDNSFVEEVVSK